MIAATGSFFSQLVRPPTSSSTAEHATTSTSGVQPLLSTPQTQAAATSFFATAARHAPFAATAGPAAPAALPYESSFGVVSSSTTTACSTPHSIAAAGRGPFSAAANAITLTHSVIVPSGSSNTTEGTRPAAHYPSHNNTSFNAATTSTVVSMPASNAKQSVSKQNNKKKRSSTERHVAGAAASAPLVPLGSDASSGSSSDGGVEGDTVNKAASQMIRGKSEMNNTNNPVTKRTTAAAATTTLDSAVAGEGASHASAVTAQHHHHHHHGGYQPPKHRLAARFQNQHVGRSLLELLAVVSVFIAAVVFLTGAHHTAKLLFAALKAEGIAGMTSTAAIRATCRRITAIADTQATHTILLIVLLYLLLQTFCVPGTVVLNAVIGALVGVGFGVPLAVVLGTAGASCCFFLSSVLGVRLVEAVDVRLMKGRGMPKIRAQVQRYRSDLFVYLLFLRLTPVLPNWLVNLGAPLANVPLLPFAAATFVGIMPQTYFAVRFGSLVQVFGGASGSSGGTGSPDGTGAGGDEKIVTVWDTLLLIVVACTILTIHRLRKRFS